MNMSTWMKLFLMNLCLVRVLYVLGWWLCRQLCKQPRPWPPERSRPDPPHSPTSPGPPRPLPSPRDRLWATSPNQICQTNNFGQTNIFRKIDQNQCFHVLGQFSVFDQCGIAGLPSLGQPKISLFLFLPLAKRAHSKAPIIQTPMKFHEKTPREVQKERKWRRERGKKTRISAPFGPDPYRPPNRRQPDLENKKMVMIDTEIVEEGEEEDRQEEGWEVESGVDRVKERQPCMAWRWM